MTGPGYQMGDRTATGAYVVAVVDQPMSNRQALLVVSENGQYGTWVEGADHDIQEGEYHKHFDSAVRAFKALVE